MDNEHDIIWISQPSANKGWPVFREERFLGAAADALDYIAGLARSAGFVAGQILALDGEVLATIASRGGVR